MSKRTVEMFLGESRYINFDMTLDLQSGQTIVSAAYTPESPVTMAVGSDAIDGTGKIAQAKFAVPSNDADGAQRTVQCTATTTNPIETVISYAVIKVKKVPT